MENGRIVMEKMIGRPLIEVLRDNSLTKQQIYKALFNTGVAVRMLHRLAVTHGDLSTNNILVDKDCNVALIDFGLSAVEYEVDDLALIYMLWMRF